MNSKYLNRILLIAILIIASFFRLWKLDKVPVSMFGDELDVGYHSYSIVKTGRDYSGNFMPLHFQSLAESRTPLFIYSTVPTVALFGITPWGVRTPAAVFGVLGVLGIYLLVKELSGLVRQGDTKKLDNRVDMFAMLSAFVLSLSPWHIQYSRAAFEVTMMLAFYLFGLLFFFKSFRNGKWMLMSVLLLVLTPLIYSTAKLFTPILLLIMFFIWRKEICGISKKYLVFAVIVGMLAGVPTAYSTLFSGGTQRFGYITVFTDPTRETEIGVKRELAAHFRGETGIGLSPTVSDKIFYNKFTYWGQRILNNYFKPFSSEFLFIKGDLNLRHSIEGIGQFYKIEAFALIVGLITFFSGYRNKKVKYFVALWILLGVIPSAITRDGGNHATRLITILIPMVIIISYGLKTISEIKKPINYILITVYCGLFILNFIFYQKSFWNENPWYSERWWHSGFKESISEIKSIESNYDEVLITMASEPAWIFFASYMNYDPVSWQNVKPDKNWVDTADYGRVTMIDKYYFTSPPGGLYDWGKVLKDNTLFLASEKEVGINLILEPERTPGNLNLIKAIAYPSGLPAFYLFEKK